MMAQRRRRRQSGHKRRPHPCRHPYPQSTPAMRPLWSRRHRRRHRPRSPSAALAPAPTRPRHRPRRRPTPCRRTTRPNGASRHENARRARVPASPTRTTTTSSPARSAGPSARRGATNNRLVYLLLRCRRPHPGLRWSPRRARWLYPRRWVRQRPAPWCRIRRWRCGWRRWWRGRWCGWRRRLGRRRGPSSPPPAPAAPRRGPRPPAEELLVIMAQRKTRAHVVLHRATFLCGWHITSCLVGVQLFG